MCLFSDGYARTKCVEGHYSSIGEAEESRDLYGASLTIVEQSPVMDVLSLDTRKTKRYSMATGVFRCTDNNDVSGVLVALEIAYPRFSFQLYRGDSCVPESLQSDGAVERISFMGEFSAKGVKITPPGSEAITMYLPRRRTYCHTSALKASK
jgi:hypothetical protein